MQAYHQYGVCSRPALYITKGCTRLVAASDKVYQLLAHGRWFSPGTPASSTTKTGHHDIAEKPEILLKVALRTINQIKSNLIGHHVSCKFTKEHCFLNSGLHICCISKD
jgi:hypothetical protein